MINLHKEFGTVTALDKITFSIPRGRIVGLLGKNGAGKSTLVRLLSGVMKPSSGNASVYGFDLDNNLEDVKRVTGLLPEEYALYEKLTVYEYIEFIGKLYDLSDEMISEQFDKMATILEMLPMRNRLIETLSKGQKQKVAIMTAIIHEPKVLFLDEPISNLDVQSQKIVKDVILNYKNDSRIIIIATHLLSNVEETCDDLLIIDKGKILFSGELSSFQGSHNTLEDAYLKFLE